MNELNGRPGADVERRIAELELENARLKRILVDLLLEKVDLERRVRDVRAGQT